MIRVVLHALTLIALTTGSSYLADLNGVTNIAVHFLLGFVMGMGLSMLDPYRIYVTPSESKEEP